MPWAVAGGMNSVPLSVPDLAPVSGKGDTTQARRWAPAGDASPSRAAGSCRTVRTLESLYPGGPDRPAAVLRADRGTQPRSGEV